MGRGLPECMILVSTNDGLYIRILLLLEFLETRRRGEGMTEGIWWGGVRMHDAS